MTSLLSVQSYQCPAVSTLHGNSYAAHLAATKSQHYTPYYNENEQISPPQYITQFDYSIQNGNNNANKTTLLSGSTLFHTAQGKLYPPTTTNPPLPVGINTTHLSTSAYLPATVLQAYKTTSEYPYFITLYPHLEDLNNITSISSTSHPQIITKPHLYYDEYIKSCGIALLTTSMPHHSTIYYSPQYVNNNNNNNNPNNNKALNNHNLTIHPTNPAKSFLPHRSNLLNVQNGFVLQPPKCSCQQLQQLQQNNNNNNNNISPSPQHPLLYKWTKCLYCLLSSSSLYDILHLGEVLLPYYFRTPLQNTTQQQQQQTTKTLNNLNNTTLPLRYPTNIAALYSPTPEYSNAVRVTVQIVFNPLASTTQRKTNNNTNILQNISRLKTLLCDKSSLRYYLLNNTVMVNSICFIYNDILTYDCVLAIIEIKSTYPYNCPVVITPNTVLQIDNIIIDSTIIQPLIQNQQQQQQPRQLKNNNINTNNDNNNITNENKTISNTVLLHTPIYTIPQLYPINLHYFATQAESVRALLKLLWVNLNKYFFCSTTTTNSLSNQQNNNEFNNLKNINIKGILLHGAPGVGKSFASIRAVELLTKSLVIPQFTQQQQQQQQQQVKEVHYGDNNTQTPPTPPTTNIISPYNDYYNKLNSILLNKPILPSITTLYTQHTIMYPVLRFVSIDSSSLGDYIQGQTERNVDDVFNFSKQRQIKAILHKTNTPHPITGNMLYKTDDIKDLIVDNWAKGFNVVKENTSQFMGIDKVYPLFNPLYNNYLDNIIQTQYSTSNSSSSSSLLEQNDNNQQSQQQSQQASKLITLQCYTVLTVLLIDEIDSICPKRDLDGSSGENVSLTNHFLILLDGMDTKSNNICKYSIYNTNTNNSNNSNEQQQQPIVIPYVDNNNTNTNNTEDNNKNNNKQSSSPCPIFIIGTTNHPNNVDMAIKRSGRLDQLLTVKPPNADERCGLLKQLTNDTKLHLNVINNLQVIADACVGYVAADLSALVRTAKLYSLKKYLNSVHNNGNNNGNDDFFYLHQQGQGHNNLLQKQQIELTLDDFAYALQNTGAASLRTNAFSSFRSLMHATTTTTDNNNENEKQEKEKENQKKLSLTAISNQQDQSNANNNNTNNKQIVLYKQLVGSFASGIGGLYEAKMRLLEAVVWPIKYRKQCQILGVTPPHGVLLHGPPGNGKTTLARAVAQSLNATFINLDMATVYNSYLGESERLLRQAFATARDNAPAVIFIDELDSIVSKRNMGDGGGDKSNDVQGRILSTLLNEMDGIPTTTSLMSHSNNNSNNNDRNNKKKSGDRDNDEVNKHLTADALLQQYAVECEKQQQQQNKDNNIISNNNNNNNNTSINNIKDNNHNTIIVFGATNRLDMLDAALLRPGRFDYIIKIDNCDLQTSYEILLAFANNKNKKVNISPEVDLIKLNERIYHTLEQSGLGCNGANITNAIYQSASIAVKRYIKQLEHKEQKQQENKNDNNTNNNNSIWNKNNDNNTLQMAKRYEIEDYFPSDYLGEKIPYIKEEDFDQYLAPLQDLIQRKKQQQQKQ